MLDLTGQTIQGKYALVLRNTETVKGGTVSAPFGYDEFTPWGVWHDTYAVSVLAPNCQLIDLDTINSGDSIAMGSRFKNGVEVGADNLKLTRVRAQSCHDDCIQDDQMRSLTVDQCMFEGYVFLSTLSPNGLHDGSDNLITITGTIAKLWPYHLTYKPGKYGYDQHGGLFKQPRPEDVGLGDGKQGIPPRVELNKCYFFASMVPKYAGTTIGCPPNVSGDDITLCWEGEGVWPEQYVEEWRERCTNVKVMSNPKYWEFCSGIWKKLFRP